MGTFNFTSLPPLSLYIHFPWCVRKCPYCDFNSHEMKTPLPQREYVKALLADVEQDLPLMWGRRVQSIFMGGGTPSLFDPEHMNTLLTRLRARLNLAPEIEITLEANPGTAEAAKFSEYRAIGINRLSIGVQSFNNDALQRLGRIHDRRSAIAAIEMAHDAGFDNFNLDLMFGLPQQSLAQALEDVHTAIALQPTHLSYYQLTLEPNTLFHRQAPTLPNDDTIADIQEHGQAALAEAGFAQYEISAYAKVARQCQHNLNYWQFGDYLGIGAGAHAKLTSAATQTIARYWKVRHPREYLEQAFSDRRFAGQRDLGEAETVLEFMMFALRLNQGFTEEVFKTHTGLSLAVAENALQRASDKGLLERDAAAIRPTAAGLRFLNDLLDIFMPDGPGDDKVDGRA